MEIQITCGTWIVGVGCRRRSRFQLAWWGTYEWHEDDDHGLGLDGTSVFVGPFYAIFGRET